jgi:hypothetical protein
MRKSLCGLAVAALLVAPGAGAQPSSSGPAQGSPQQSLLVPPLATSMDTMSNARGRIAPIAWCLHAPNGSHCRSRAATEHAICLDAVDYDDCRRALYPMHSR